MLHDARPLALLAAAATLLAATSASAADKKTKIAVLDVKAVGTVKQDEVKGIGALVTTALAKQPELQVISTADIQALIGFEKQKELLGCGEASCLAEIGGALGVDYIAGTEVAEIGGTYLVTLSMISIAKAKSMGRITKRLPFLEQVPDATVKGVSELLQIARARETEDPSKRNVKVAVMDVKASGLDLGTVEGLAALVASEVAARPEVQITTGADIRAVMGFEKQRALLGCDEATCIAEIGGALGVDYIITTDVSKVADEWILSMSMVNIKKAKAANRVVARVRRLELLVDNATSAVKELFFELSEKKAGPVGHYVKREERSNAFGWLMLGTGVAMAGTGAFFEVKAFKTQSAFDANEDIGRDEAVAAFRDNGLAIGLFVGGGALVLYSGWELLFRGEDEGSGQVYVAPTSGGAAAAFSTPF